jgi:hypothetical protein
MNMIRLGETGLYYNLILPDKSNPEMKKTIARVSDGKETVEYTFSADLSVEHILKRIPRLYMDRIMPPKQKVKGILHGKTFEIKKNGKTINAILLNDNCIMFFDED